MHQSLESHGFFPSDHIYKAFSKMEYALDFVDRGRFRFGALATYKNIEDANRRDNSEGVGSFRTPGNVTSVHFDKNDLDSTYATEAPGYVNVHTELGNPVYVFSTSLSTVSIQFLAEKFGRYIVQIDNPKELADQITHHLKTRTEKFAGGIEGVSVSYNAGEVIEESLNNFERTTLSYSQKPVSFSSECEFRFVSINIDSPENRMNSDYMNIDLGGPVKYARLLADT